MDLFLKGSLRRSFLLLFPGAGIIHCEGYIIMSWSLAYQAQQLFGTYVTAGASRRPHKSNIGRKSIWERCLHYSLATVLR